MKISLICVFNNKIQLEEQLKPSIEKQIGNIETIFLDCNTFRFKSAAEALNYGANISSGDVLVFSHQDIIIKEFDGLLKFGEAIYNAEIGDIVGTQGVREKSKIYYSNLTAGKEYNKQYINDFEEKMIEVSCVDEGLFGMKKETWISHKFDEMLCDNWHLYAVESALFARTKGHRVWVYPIQMHHFSYGKISLQYMIGLKRLCYHYRNNFKYIWTTCYKVRTSGIYINCLFVIWIINRKIRGKKL